MNDAPGQDTFLETPCPAVHRTPVNRLCKRTIFWDTKMVPDSLAAEQQDFKPTGGLGGFHGARKQPAVELSDPDAEMVSEALPYTAAILDDSASQSAMSPWMMQRASTHRYRKPRLLVMPTASRIVNGRSSSRYPRCRSSSVSLVVVNAAELPKQ